MEVCIFTRGKNEKLLNLINELQNQTLKPVIKVFSDNYIDLWGVSVISTPGLNISQKRNLAIKTSEKEYLLLLDDDNKLKDNKFLEKLIDFYNKINFEPKIISPLIMYRQTGLIQSWWVKFNYLFWKVFVNKKIKWDFWEVDAVWGNSLFSKKENFKKVFFDEKIGFIREDIDFAYSFREKWWKIFIVNLPIYHLERDKNIAEKSFVYKDAFRIKVKNRDIFVSKHWNLFQKLWYWLFGRWVSLGWWFLKRLISK